jgi:glycosyltransferase involved in cell wall biosynthesis
LQANEFNAAKSDIKALDYAFSGLPAIFSAVGPYKVAIEHGKTGLLVPNDTTSWIRAMSMLLDDPALRERIRIQAREWAERRNEGSLGRVRAIAQEAFGWNVPE